MFKPANPANRQLYFVPFFVFKADAEGKLVVKEEDPLPGETTVRVHVFLLASPHQKLTDIARLIRAKEKVRPILPQFADIEAEHLIGIPLHDLTITENDPKPVFRPLTLRALSTPGEIQLTADLTPGSAKRLRDGKQLPVFRISYGLNARFTLSESRAEGKGIFLYETNAATQLSGAGAAFRWDVRPQGGNIEQQRVTREQKKTFEGRLRKEIEIFYDIEDDRDFVILQKDLNDYFAKVFANDKIDLNENFAAELTRLSAYDFPPTDLQPGQLNKLVADVKNFFQSKDELFVNTEAGASASFLGIGGSASLKHTKKQLRERMEDKGWKFELSGDGGHFVPKSLEVFVVNETALKQEGVTRVGIARHKGGLARFTSLVSTDKAFYPGDVATAGVEIAELKAALKENKSDFDMRLSALAAQT